MQVDLRVDHDLAVCADKQGVTVGLRSRGQFNGNAAIGPGMILHHHGTAQRPAQSIGKHPGGDVRCATRRHIGNHAQATRRVLRVGAGTKALRPQQNQAAHNNQR